MRLIENRKRALDENFLIGAVLVDLSKAFDCIPLGLSEETNLQITIQFQLHPKTDTLLEILKNETKSMENWFKNNK